MRLFWNGLIVGVAFVAASVTYAYPGESVVSSCLGREFVIQFCGYSGISANSLREQSEARKVTGIRMVFEKQPDGTVGFPKVASLPFEPRFNPAEVGTRFTRWDQSKLSMTSIELGGISRGKPEFQFLNRIQFTRLGIILSRRLERPAGTPEEWTCYLK